MLAVFGLLAAGCGDDESGDAESAALNQARAETAAAQAEADAAAAQADSAAADAAAAAAQADSAAAAAADAEEALAAAMADAGSSEGVDPAVVADLERQLGEAQDAAAEAEAAAAAAAEAAEAALAAVAAQEAMAEEEMAGPELGEITTIKLIANPWAGSAANIEVAKQLLENEFGYTVEVTDLDENAQWAAINTGELHASLEVWPSGHADNRADFIDNPDGNVVDAGLLGPIGQIGWYQPAYMIDRNPALASAEGFTDPELAGLFATAETGDRGQILHGDPSWVTFEQDIIDDFGLHLEIVYAGSEEALLAAFEGASARNEPVLAYWWKPHPAVSVFDLVELELPLDPDGNKYYPPDELFKIVWSGLEDGAPAAWEFLHNFNYSTDDQLSMLGAIGGEGKSAEEAAADWIAANEATWSAWIPS